MREFVKVGKKYRLYQDSTMEDILVINPYSSKEDPNWDVNVSVSYVPLLRCFPEEEKDYHCCFDVAAIWAITEILD